MIIKNLFAQYKAVAFVCLVMSFISCSKDGGDDPVVIEEPKITLEASGLSVVDGIISVSITQDSVLSLKYSVEAAGKIKKLDQTLDGVVETIVEANTKTSFSKDILLDVPLEDKSYALKVEVTDENGKSTASSVSIRVRAIIPPSVPLTQATSIVMGGPASGSNSSRWDLDMPAGYTGFSLRCATEANPNPAVNCDKVPYMDSFYERLSLENTDTESNRFANTDARFLVTGFTKAEFEAMKNDLPLQKLVIDQTKVEFAVGQVIAFKTNEGKIGVLYVDKYDESEDDTTFIQKIQQ